MLRILMSSIPSSTATFFRNEKLCCLNIMIAAIQHNEPMTSLEGWGIPPCPSSYSGMPVLRGGYSRSTITLDFRLPVLSNLFLSYHADLSSLKTQVNQFVGIWLSDWPIKKMILICQGTGWAWYTTLMIVICYYCFFFMFSLQDI